jgi:hypothetical protein
MHWRGRFEAWVLRHNHLFLWLPECALLAAVLWIGHAISLELKVDGMTVLWPALSWAVVRIWGGSRLPDDRRSRAFASSVAVWLVIWSVYEWRLTGHFSRIQLAMAVYMFLGLAVLRWWRAAAPDRALGESCRILLLAAGALWLVRPFVSPAFRGSSDSQAYANMTADMQEQVRLGVFPVFVGQSEYQFNGATYSVRIAPAFHYLGAILDAATLRVLDPVALQNLLLALLGVAAVILCYGSLTALAPGRRWLAGLLSLLFLACPGVLALLYDGDLYMTWTTLPLFPIVVYGLVRSFDRPDWATTGCLAGGLGLMWWGHTPIAVWMTGLVAISQAVRVAVRFPGWGPLARESVGIVIFAGIAAYPLVSVLGYSLGAATPPTPAEAITLFVRDAFPAVLLPVSELGRAVADFQLGYSCWIIWLTALVVLLAKRRAVGLFLLAASAGLMLLLTPVPGLNLQLWRIVPEIVRAITAVWAMYRLYVILAALVIVAGWLAFNELLARAPAARFVLYPALLGMCVWSAREADKFILTGLRGPESGRQLMLLENVPLMRYAYVNFPAPPQYYTHGVTEAHLESRLLRRGKLDLLAGDIESIERGAVNGARVVAEGSLQANPAEIPIYHYYPKVTLLPGRHYGAVFDFKYPAATLVLVVHGQLMFRIYALPEYGGPKSFGAAPGHPRLLPLWTDGNEPEDVQFEFRTQGAWAAKDLSAPGSFRLIEYDPAQLPVQVTSFIPYRARVNAPEEAWLETPRMYQPGYQAVVNGRRVDVAKSPSALVMVPVPAGTSAVKVQYYPPLGLWGAFWVSFAVAIAVSCWILWSLAGRARPNLRASARDSPRRGPAGGEDGPFIVSDRGQMG